MDRSRSRSLEQLMDQDSINIDNGENQANKRSWCTTRASGCSARARIARELRCRFGSRDGTATGLFGSSIRPRAHKNRTLGRGVPLRLRELDPSKRQYINLGGKSEGVTSGRECKLRRVAKIDYRSVMGY